VLQGTKVLSITLGIHNEILTTSSNMGLLQLLLGAMRPSRVVVAFVADGRLAVRGAALYRQASHTRARHSYYTRVLQTLCRARPPRGGHGVRPESACVRGAVCSACVCGCAPPCVFGACECRDCATLLPRHYGLTRPAPS